MASYYRKLDLRFLGWRKKYRSQFEITALMLEAMKSNAASSYSIMRYARINHKQVKKYLGPLTEMGFVDVDLKKSRVLYRASEKGLAFLRQYYVLLGMLLGACTQNSPLTLSMKLNMYSMDDKPH